MCPCSCRGEALLIEDVQGLPLLAYVIRPNEKTPGPQRQGRETNGPHPHFSDLSNSDQGTRWEGAERIGDNAEIFKNYSLTLLFLFIALETSLMSLLCFCPARLKRSLVNQAAPAGHRHGFPCSFCQRSFFCRCCGFLLTLPILPFTIM